MSALLDDRPTVVDRPAVVHSVHLFHPFDLELDGVPDALDLYVEEVDDVVVGPMGQCDQTLSTVACDCATTLSTLFCLSCELPDFGDS